MSRTFRKTQLQLSIALGLYFSTAFVLGNDQDKSNKAGAHKRQESHAAQQQAQLLQQQAQKQAQQRQQ